MRLFHRRNKDQPPAACARAEAKASRTGRADRVPGARAAGVDAARLCGAGARGLRAGTPSSIAAVRLIAEAAASVPWLLYDGAAELDRASAARAARAAEPAPGRRRLPRGARRPSARRRQRLCRGGGADRPTGRRRPVRELHALRPDRMKVVPGADGWPEAYEYTVGGRTVRFADPGERRLVADPASVAVPSARRPLRLRADRGGGGGARHPQRRRRLEQGAARQFGAALRRAGLSGEGRRQPLRRAVRAAEGASWRPASPARAHAGRPLLLEGGLDWKSMGADAEGHGFPRGQERRGARDRARLRRAADAARHSRRQHLCQLPGGQPRLLARHRAAAGRRASPTRSAPGWRRRSASEARGSPGSTPTRSTALSPTARRCGRGSAAADFLTVNEKRAAVGYGPVDGAAIAVPDAAAGEVRTTVD